MNTATVIPYHLRPHKAIERQIFFEILTQLDRSSFVELRNYRYVGFGAPFLEDFKGIHLEFGIEKMDCIESDAFAYSRQLFNSPFNFINFYNTPATLYITGANYPRDENKVIWLDYTSPREFKQQLLDAELLGQRLLPFDIVKFTFSSSLKAFMGSNSLGLDTTKVWKILELFKKDPGFEVYLPDEVTLENIADNFSSVVRSMASRAIKRGLANSMHGLTFNHIASFYYADGLQMTTVTGIIAEAEVFKDILSQSGLMHWRFFQPEMSLTTGHEITVPVMTVSERIKIDQSIPTNDSTRIANDLAFRYGSDENEHHTLIKGYCDYYKYLPYYSKVTY